MHRNFLLLWICKLISMRIKCDIHDAKGIFRICQRILSIARYMDGISCIMLRSTIKSSRIYVCNYAFPGTYTCTRVPTYVYTCKYAVWARSIRRVRAAKMHSCMYSRIRERVRDICLSSIHTRLLITYSSVSVPRRIARRYTYIRYITKHTATLL